MMRAFLLDISRRVLVGGLVILLAVSPSLGYAQSAFVAALPEPGTMLRPSDAFTPVLVKGLVVHPQEPLRFDFIVDSGSLSADQRAIREESERIAKYFLAAVTVPEDQLWVNLSPVEQDRIIEEELGQTVLGRDMLAQDYILKQLTASMIYPEDSLGQEFWGRVYREAREKFGTTDIPVDTFNKVWITPEKAEVYEKDNAVYVTDARLKVMLESDYLAAEVPGSRESGQQPSTQDLAQSVVREIVLPAIEQEVNEGRNFAVIRQIYHAAILAKWYRELIRETLLAGAYVGKNRVSGITSGEKALKEEIYQRYMAAYKKGAFSYIKEDPDPFTGAALPRKYFSGGISRFSMRGMDIGRTADDRKLDSGGEDSLVSFRMGRVGEVRPVEMAMTLRDELHAWFNSSRPADEKRNALIGPRRFHLSPDGFVPVKMDGISVSYLIGRSPQDRGLRNQLASMVDRFKGSLPASVRDKVVFLTPASYHVTTVDIAALKEEYRPLRPKIIAMLSRYMQNLPEKFRQGISARVRGINTFAARSGIIKFDLEMDRTFLDDFGRDVWAYLSSDPQLKDIYRDVPFKPGDVTYHVTAGYLMEPLEGAEVDQFADSVEASFDPAGQIDYIQPVGGLTGFSDMNTFYPWRTSAEIPQDLQEQISGPEKFLKTEPRYQSMLSQIALVASDVGGTLDDGGAQSQEKSAVELEALLDAGVPVALVTMGGIEGLYRKIISRIASEKRRHLRVFWGGGVILSEFNENGMPVDRTRILERSFLDQNFISMEDYRLIEEAHRQVSGDDGSAPEIKYANMAEGVGYSQVGIGDFKSSEQRNKYVGKLEGALSRYLLNKIDILPDGPFGLVLRRKGVGKVRAFDVLLKDVRPEQVLYLGDEFQVGGVDRDVADLGVWSVSVSPDHVSAHPATIRVSGAAGVSLAHGWLAAVTGYAVGHPARREAAMQAQAQMVMMQILEKIPGGKGLDRILAIYHRDDGRDARVVRVAEDILSRMATNADLKYKIGLEALKNSRHTDWAINMLIQSGRTEAIAPIAEALERVGLWQIGLPTQLALSRFVTAPQDLYHVGAAALKANKKWENRSTPLIAMLGRSQLPEARTLLVGELDAGNIMAAQVLEEMRWTPDTERRQVVFDLATGRGPTLLERPQGVQPLLLDLLDISSLRSRALAVLEQMGWAPSTEREHEAVFQNALSTLSVVAFGYNADLLKVRKYLDLLVRYNDRRAIEPIARMLSDSYSAGVKNLASDALHALHDPRGDLVYSTGVGGHWTGDTYDNMGYEYEKKPGWYPRAETDQQPAMMREEPPPGEGSLPAEVKDAVIEALREEPVEFRVTAEAAMVSEALQWAAAHPYLASAALGSAVSATTVAASLMSLGRDRYLHKFYIGDKKPEDRGLTWMLRIGYSPIFYALFWWMNPFILVPVSIPLLAYAEDYTTLNDAQVLLVPYIFQASVGTTAIVLSWLLSGRKGEKYDAAMSGEPSLRMPQFVKGLAHLIRTGSWAGRPPELAIATEASSTGGIDMKDIGLRTTRSGAGIHFNEAAIREAVEGGFEGFMPVFLQMTPLKSPRLLFGATADMSQEAGA